MKIQQLPAALKQPITRVMIALSTILLIGAVVFSQRPVSAQSNGEGLDPRLSQGAWLYRSHCEECHGAYGDERVGRRLKRKELEAKIAGKKRSSCEVVWAKSKGGPLSASQIKAITYYIAAWEQVGREPDLPPYSPLPTPTAIPKSRATVKPAGTAQATSTSIETVQTRLPISLTSTPTSSPASVAGQAEGSEALKAIFKQDSVAHGAWLYQEHCYRCHYAYADYRQGKGATADFVRDNIVNGNDSMEPFSIRNGGELRTSEINAVVDYIMTWEELEGPPPLPAPVATAMSETWPDRMAGPHETPSATPRLAGVGIDVNERAAGDLETGRVLFQTYCTACHGFKGEGGLGKPLARAWEDENPQDLIRSVIANGVENTIMQAWSVEQNGPLSTQDIDNLTAYILAMPSVSVDEQIWLDPTPTPLMTQ